MSAQYQFFNIDSMPESTLRRMKQNEDFVPQEFVSDIFIHKEIDSSASGTGPKQKFYTQNLSDRNSLENQFSGRTASDNYFPFIIMTISLLLLLSVKIFYLKSLKQFYESLVSFIKFRLWIRDTGSLLNNMFFLTIPAYIIIFALAIDILINKYSGGEYDFLFFRYGAIFISLMIFLGLRYVLMLLSAVIFNSKTAVEEQLRNINLHNTLLMYLLMVILPLSIYLPEVKLYLSIIPVIILIEGIRIVKAFISAKTLKQYSVYYFFLYFCTVEILPVLLLVKLVLS